MYNKFSTGANLPAVITAKDTDGNEMANVNVNVYRIDEGSYGDVAVTSLGTVTMAPCKSIIVSPWMNTKTNVLACGKPVCTNASTCQCMWGGVITIINIKNHTVL